MGHFSGVCKLELITPQPNHYWYEPDPYEPLTFHATEHESYTIVDSFETDLASVPRCLWCLPGFATGDWPRPAILHDWLFQRNHDGIPVVGFEQANELLEEAMLAEGAYRLIAWLYKITCNLFGYWRWDNNQRA